MSWLLFCGCGSGLLVVGGGRVRGDLGGGVCNSDEFHKSYAYLKSKNTQKVKKNAFFAPKRSVVFADGLEIKFTHFYVLKFEIGPLESGNRKFLSVV